MKETEFKYSDTHTCYFHGVEDPNEEHFDPDKYVICVICATKLWELAQVGVQFKYRGEIIDLKIKPHAAEDLIEEPSALPASENDYGLSGKALRDYLKNLKCE